MRNINISNIPKSQEIQAYVQFKIMEWTAKKVLDSLGNPVDIVEARLKLAEIISTKWKYKKYFPLTDDILDKILAVSFKENINITKAIDLFIRKHTANIAKAKIDSVISLWNLANKGYRSVNKIDEYEKIYDN